MISLLLWDICIPVFFYIDFILLRFERNEKYFSKSYYFLLQSYGMKHCNARACVVFFKFDAEFIVAPARRVVKCFFAR